MSENAEILYLIRVTFSANNGPVLLYFKISQKISIKTVLFDFLGISLIILKRISFSIGFLISKPSVHCIIYSCNEFCKHRVH